MTRKRILSSLGQKPMSAPRNFKKPLPDKRKARELNLPPRLNLGPILDKEAAAAKGNPNPKPELWPAS